MAITTIAELRSALSTAQILEFSKTKSLRFSSTWTLAGLPAAGIKEGTLVGSVPTKDTAGALPFTNSTSGKNYILQANFPNHNWGNDGATVYLYDVLWHNSEMSGTVTTTTTLGSTPALTRPDANGEDTEIWYTAYTAIGSTAATLTLTYTNQAGTTGRTATFIKTGNTNVNALFKVSLESGDTGVRSIQSYSWNITNGTVGNFGLLIARRTCELSMWTLNGGRTTLDWSYLGMPEVYNDACLQVWYMSNGNNATFQGEILLGNG